jgi:hypothetical protein
VAKYVGVAKYLSNDIDYIAAIASLSAGDEDNMVSKLSERQLCEMTRRVTACAKAKIVVKCVNSIAAVLLSWHAVNEMAL